MYSGDDVDSPFPTDLDLEEAEAYDAVDQRQLRRQKTIHLIFSILSYLLSSLIL